MLWTFDLLWIYLVWCPQQIKRAQQIHSISTCHDVVDSTTNPQQIESMEYAFRLAVDLLDTIADE
jgi:hypothetical protein